jgi:hypothetical protein
MRTLFKRPLLFGAFLVLALSWPSLYFHFFPLPAFDQALEVYKGQAPLVLGGRDGFSQGESFHRRNYILLPSFFHDPKFINVTQLGSKRPDVTETGATFELLIILVFLLFSITRSLRADRSEA